MKKNKVSGYRKGQEIKVRIIDIGMRGEGIGKLEDGYTVFIKDAVVGDYVRASIMKANKSYAYAHLDQILQASPHRVEPLCPVARQCGGCQLQALSYEQELVYKQNKVRADLIRIGGFPEEEIDSVMEPIVGMQDNPTGWNRSSECRTIRQVPGDTATRRRCRLERTLQEELWQASMPGEPIPSYR